MFEQKERIEVAKQRRDDMYAMLGISEQRVLAIISLVLLVELIAFVVSLLHL